MEKDLYWQVLLFRKCVIEQFNFYFSVKTEGLSENSVKVVVLNRNSARDSTVKRKKSANNHINIISEVIRESKDEKTVSLQIN